MKFRDLIKRVKKVDLLQQEIQKLERKNAELNECINRAFKRIDSLEKINENRRLQEIEQNKINALQMHFLDTHKIEIQQKDVNTIKGILQ